MKNSISQNNSKYWNEVCGSHAAKVWKIKNHSEKELSKFDKLYFEYYPYIMNYLFLNKLQNKKVLEIGTGYGSVASKLMSVENISLTFLDIAKGPIEILKKRNSYTKKKKKTVFLNKCIFSHNLPNESFDYIFAIGCLHHTGNLAKAVDNCYKLLKKDGVLVGMVYSSFSYRRWFNNFFQTFKFMFYQYTQTSILELETTDKSYDVNAEGKSPPATEFASKTSIKQICKKFKNVSVKYENIVPSFPFTFFKRDFLLKTFLPNIFGIDLYFIAKK